MISKASHFTKAAAEGILSATDRWRVLWECVADRDGGDYLRQVGLIRHAPEVWWLTRAIVKASQLGNISCRYMDPTPTESVKHLHEFIDKYKGMWLMRLCSHQDATFDILQITYRCSQACNVNYWIRGYRR